MKTTYCITAAILLGVAFPAGAEPIDFAQCDGMPEPREMSVERAERRNYLGMENPPFSDGPKVTSAQDGIRACDRALADTMLRESYWLRRAYLLQARAYHQIWASDFAAAIISLDEADALARPDASVLYEDSVAIASRALRALALLNLNRAVEAESLLVEIERTRPYSVSTMRLARAVRLLHSPDLKGDIELLRRHAVLDPSLFYQLFIISLMRGDLADAITYAQQVSFDIPRDRRGWSVQGQPMLEERLIEARATFDGAVAYALFANGQPDAAAARIAAARADLASAAPPAVGTAGGERVTEAERAAWPLRQAIVQNGERVLDQWEATIRLRSDIASTTLQSLQAAARARDPTTALVFADILRHVTANSDADRPAVANAAAEYERKILSDYLRREALQLPDVGRLLPRPEFTDMRPRMRGEGANIIQTNLEGYAVRTQENSDVTNVRYGDLTASTPMIEEVAMLAAAKHAREEGFDSIVITVTQILERTTQTRDWSGTSTSPSGHEFRIVMRAVNASAPPPDLSTASWRLISADAIIAQLGPLYDQGARPAQN